MVDTPAKPVYAKPLYERGRVVNLRLYTYLLTCGHGFFTISLADPVLRSGPWLHPSRSVSLKAAKVMLYHAWPLVRGEDCERGQI